MMILTRCLLLLRKKFPGAWHANFFAHLSRTNVPKNEKRLYSGVDVDDIAKDLTGIGNLNSIGRSDDSIERFKEKEKL